MVVSPFVGERSGILVLRPAVSHFKSQAEGLVDVPQQIRVSRAVVSSTREAIGNAGDVVIVRIVNRIAGVAVQTRRPVEEAFEPTARGPNGPPGDVIDGLQNRAVVSTQTLSRIGFPREA